MNRRRGSLADERGFTLVETLVVMLLLAIIGTILTSSMIQAMRTASKQEDQTRTLNAAKVALERLTRELRGANSLVTTTAQEVAFVTRTEGVRRETRILARVTATGTELVQLDETSDLTTGAALGSKEKVLLGGLATGRSEAVFTYYAGDYYGEGDPRTLALNPATPGAARTIGVRVRVLRAHGAAPLELYQVVSVRNLEA